jgi:hypothetical protein
MGAKVDDKGDANKGNRTSLYIRHLPTHEHACAPPVVLSQHSASP